jgi:thiol-disulfide isomerase/thioredoxin
MRKPVALVLALILVLTVSFSAVAEEQQKITWYFSEAGIVLTAPDSIIQAKGMIYPLTLGEIDPERKIACAFLQYVPLNDEELALVYEDEANLTEEQKARIIEIYGRAVLLYYFCSVGNGKTFEDVQDVILKGASPDGYSVYELGRIGEDSFYLMVPKPDSEETVKFTAQFPEDCRQEYIDLLKDTDAVIAGVTVQEPMRPGDAVGSVISFELTDFSGNPVSSEDLFAGHKVTLVNLWASWCGPCVAEMPQLEALWQEYGAKGAGFVGICLDGYKEKCLAEAKQIAADCGVTYPLLACTKDVETRLRDSVVAAYPTTVFVNEKGEILASPISGVRIDAYRETLERFLSEP